jgi:hypothetical protein
MLKRETVSRRWTMIGVGLAILVFAPGLLSHAWQSSNHSFFADDARQWVVPYFGGALEPDALTTYFRDLAPPGYRTLYRAAQLGGGAETLSKVLPYLLLAAGCAFAAATAARLGGSIAGIFTVCFLLSTGPALARITGGTPRAFAFPILAAAAWGLTRRSPLVLAATTIAGTAFYPPTGLLGGVLLVVTMPPGRKELIRHLALVAAVALLCLGMLAPSLVAQRIYGSRIGFGDLAAFPEAGPEGRYWPPDRPPFASLPAAAGSLAGDALRFAGHRFLPVPVPLVRILRVLALLFAGAGLALCARRSAEARRLLLLPLAACGLYLLSVPLWPWLFTPERYLAYALTLLPAIGIPLAAASLARATNRIWVSPLACLLLLAVLGGTGGLSTGLTVNAQRDALLFSRLARVPDLRLLAGWPKGPIENVPYVCRKPAFVTFETHAAFHTTMVETLRTKMRAFVAAYFADGPAPLLRLREEFGVTHLLVDRRHFHGPPPLYFAPFDGEIRAAAAGLRGREPEVLRQAGHAAVFQSGHWILLDLRRIESPPAAP